MRAFETGCRCFVLVLGAGEQCARRCRVLALDRRFGFPGAAAALMLVQVLAVDRRFGFAGASAVLMLMLVQALAVDRRLFAAAVTQEMTPCHAQNDIMSCQTRHHGMPRMASCHAQNRHRVMPGMTCCHIVRDNVLHSNDHNVIWSVLAGLCRSCSITTVFGKAGAFWTGLMLPAAVTAVHCVSYASAIWEVYADFCDV